MAGKFTLGKSAVAALTMVLITISAHSNERVALIVGNSSYPNAPLINPRNDANAMADLLGRAGFAVDKQLDTSLAQLQVAVDRFGAAIRDPKVKFGLFYYAGHGLQQDWRNYIVPVSANIRASADVPKQAVDVSNLMRYMEQATGRSFLIVLDACRDDPFAGVFKPSSKGLTQFDAPVGSLLAYATSPGNIALDGNGKNGLYTGFLLREFAVPGARLEDAFKRVRLSVRMASKGAQVPWESTSLEEDIYLFPLVKRDLSEADRDALLEQEMISWLRVKSSPDPEVLASFIREYPSGSASELAQSRMNRLLAAATAQEAQSAERTALGVTKAARDLAAREGAARLRVAQADVARLAASRAEAERSRLAQLDIERAHALRQALAAQVAAQEQAARLAAQQAQAAEQAAMRQAEAQKEASRISQQRAEAAAQELRRVQDQEVRERMLAQQAEQARAQEARVEAVAREESLRLAAQQQTQEAQRVQAAQAEKARIALQQAEAQRLQVAQQEAAQSEVRRQQAAKDAAALAEAARQATAKALLAEQEAQRAVAAGLEIARQNQLQAQAAQVELQRLAALQTQKEAVERDLALSAEKSRVQQEAFAQELQQETARLAAEKQSLQAAAVAPMAPETLAATPYFKGYAEHQRSFTAGDSYTTSVIDAFTKVSKPLVMKVSQVDVNAERVVYNDGEFVSDLMGNTTTNQRGTFSTPRQFYPAALIVGNKWQTRFKQTRPSGITYTFQYDLKVVAKERITVPAGTFDAFKIEARGFNMELGASLERNIWVTPGVNADIAHEIKVRLRSGRWEQNDRQELVSIVQAVK